MLMNNLLLKACYSAYAFIFVVLSCSVVRAEKSNTIQGFELLSFGKRVENINQIQKRKDLVYFVNEQKPFSGEVVDKKNDCIYSSENYLNGLKHGGQLYYFKDSCGKKISKKLTFKHGIHHGKQIRYFSNGQIQTSIDYKLNRRFNDFEELLSSELDALEYDPKLFETYNLYALHYSVYFSEIEILSYFQNGIQSTELIMENGVVKKDTIFNKDGVAYSGFENVLKLRRKTYKEHKDISSKAEFDEQTRREALVKTKEKRDKILANIKVEQKKKDELRKRLEKEEQNKRLAQKLIYLNRIEDGAFFYTEKDKQSSDKVKISLSRYDNDSLAKLTDYGFSKHVGKKIYKEFRKCNKNELEDIVSKKISNAVIDDNILSYYEKKCVRATCLLNCSEYGKIETILSFNLYTDSIELFSKVIREAGLDSCKEFIKDKSIIYYEFVLNKNGGLETLSSNSGDDQLNSCVKGKLSRQKYSYMGVEVYKTPIRFN